MNFESRPLPHESPIAWMRAILWLLSDQSSYTTGSFIEVTGGK